VIDRELAVLVRKAAGKRSAVFHRAFDFTADLMESAGILLDIGVDRILTSGKKETAWEGRDSIRELIQCFGSSPEILPGSGISSGNALQLVEHTGCRWIHGSFKGGVSGGTRDLLPSASPGPSAVEIQKVIQLLNGVQ
jgi:copper homeostasis protein